MPELVPLRVDVGLGGLMAVGDQHPVMLDSLLLALLGTRIALPFPSDALPLASWRDASWKADDFCWAASAVEVAWTGPPSDRMLHRNARPLELLEDAHLHSATSVDFDRGLTKVGRKRFTVRQALGATAWCIGAAAPLGELLARLQVLGPYRHQGFGIVRSVQITEDAEALTKAWQRPLPGPHPEDPFADRRYRSGGRAAPPYWDRDLSMQAWWPRSTGHDRH